jgi:hypothetical protein
MTLRSVAAAAVVFTLTAGAASAAVDFFIKIDGVHEFTTPADSAKCVKAGGTVTPTHDGKKACLAPKTATTPAMNAAGR